MPYSSSGTGIEEEGEEEDVGRFLIIINLKPQLTPLDDN
jgi:hypothetical protein